MSRRILKRHFEDSTPLLNAAKMKGKIFSETAFSPFPLQYCLKIRAVEETSM